MSYKLNCILLVDDDEPTNFIHKIILKDTGLIKNIEVAETGQEALKILECSRVGDCISPELIFLDLNMPGMTGWEFLDNYVKLKTQLSVNSKIIILTTSANPDDEQRAKNVKEIVAFRTKPLTETMFQEIVETAF